MDRTSLLFGLAIGTFVAGLAVLLYGEHSGLKPFVFAGSAVVVLGVALLTGIVAGLDEPGGPEGAP